MVTQNNATQYGRMRTYKDMITNINISTGDSGGKPDAAAVRIGHINCDKRGNIAVFTDMDCCTLGIDLGKTSYISTFANRRVAINPDKGMIRIVLIINSTDQA